MPGGLGPRFALEAGFLILLAVLVGLADLRPALIVLVMAIAWLLVALIEYFAWRQSPRFPGVRRSAPAAEPIPAPSEEEAAPLPAQPPPPPPPEEETLIEPVARAHEPSEAGSPEETIGEADERVAAKRLAFDVEDQRTRFRLTPLEPRPRRRWGLFGSRQRPGEDGGDGGEVESQAEDSREEER